MKKLLLAFIFNLVFISSLFANINQIKGRYVSCSPSIYGSEYYDQIRVKIRKKNRRNIWVQRASLHKNSDCSDSPINNLTTRYIIKNIQTISQARGEKVMDLRLKVKRAKVTLFDNNYFPFINNLSECGFTDWSSGASKNVTGLTCPFLLEADAFRDTYRQRNASRFIQIRFSNRGGIKSLEIPYQSSMSGDTRNEREDDNFLVLDGR